MVKLSTFVFTIVLCAASAFSVAISHRPHDNAVDTSTTGRSQLQSPQTLAVREPGWFSLASKLFQGAAKASKSKKAVVKAVKSKKGRKVMKKVAKGAYTVVENY
ncbi:hypothetical protein BDN70DRAFT_938660 [Pholiota conissans]|uniref:Uncharacterized protein n=1 Tax=Pholiota conissans TaxID=109636 RepID=A0A9P6CTP1_9AGAR|nr:hypothetical protein BDN70DRAFT_938660 [Pholiota conissans]